MISEGKREDIIAILSNIAQTCRQLGGKISEVPSSFSTTDLKLYFDTVAQTAEQEIFNIDQPFRLGVVGMFKSGKSSVLNTFLKRAVLKEGRTETTSVLTELKFAVSLEEEKGTILFTDGSSEDMLVSEALEYTDVRSELFRKLSTQERYAKQESISKITLKLHCEFLRNVVLLDTPGFGGSNIGDKKALEALLNVDAALMVFPADRVGTQNELEIADELSRRGREIVVLLNKVDDDQGNLRTEDALQGAESFIREHFRTIVKDYNNKPLIFRFSAKEIWKALHILAQGTASEEQERDAFIALARWGYLGIGEEDCEKGVINFIREHYSGSQVEKKIGNARTNLLKALNGLIETLLSERSQIEASKGTASDDYAKRRENLERKINPKINQINIQIGDIIQESTQPFLRDVETALLNTLNRFSQIDVDAVFRFFKSEADVQEEIVQEFRKYLPQDREMILGKSIERQIRSLLEREWMFISNQIGKMEISTQMPDPSLILKDVKKAVERLAMVITGEIAALIGLLFASGGGIVVAFLAFLFTDALENYFSSKLNAKRALAGAQISAQVKNLAVKLNFSMLDQAQEMNDQMAEKARQSIFAGLSEVEQQIKSSEDLMDAIDKASITIKRMKELLGAISI